MCSGRLSLYTEMRQGTFLRLPQVREGLPRWRMRAVSPVRHANLPGTTQRRSPTVLAALVRMKLIV